MVARLKNVKFLLFIYLALLSLLSGCTFQRSLGTLQTDGESGGIENYQINPQYDYYYFGSYHAPDAVIGIDDSYQVQSRFWSEVDLTQEKLEAWVKTFDRKSRTKSSYTRYQGDYSGARILNPEGKPVGVWYSRLEWGVFEFPEDNVIVPYPPSYLPGRDPSTKDKRD